MTNPSPETIVAWVRAGMIAGIAADLVYATFFFIPWPLSMAVLVALSFGVLLMVAAVGRAPRSWTRCSSSSSRCGIHRSGRTATRPPRLRARSETASTTGSTSAGTCSSRWGRFCSPGPRCGIRGSVGGSGSRGWPSPSVGLWYLVVSIRALTSMRWVRERVGEGLVRYPAG